MAARAGSAHSVLHYSVCRGSIPRGGVDAIRAAQYLLAYIKYMETRGVKIYNRQFRDKIAEIDANVFNYRDVSTHLNCLNGILRDLKFARTLQHDMFVDLCDFVHIATLQKCAFYKG